MKIELPSVRQWMEEHESAQLAQSASREFENYLNSLPWAPSRLDWRFIDHSVFTMVDPWEDGLVEFASHTPLGRHGHVMIMYSGDEPSLLSVQNEALRDLDLIYSACPAPSYFCGVDVVEGRPMPYYEDFAEFDGFSKITFRG